MQNERDGIGIVSIGFNSGRSAKHHRIGPEGDKLLIDFDERISHWLNTPG